MDATKLIEEAGQLTTEEFASGATPGPWVADDLLVIMAGEEAVAECYTLADATFIARARTLVPDLAAALKASEERARKAEDEEEELRELVARYQEASGIDVGGDPGGVTPEILSKFVQSEEARAKAAEKQCVELAAANLAANKRIVELEHERDAARAELARLTTPQPGEPLDMDCGDSSCAFAKTRGGMRTNGGCRCLENLGFCRGQTDSLRRMAAEIVSLRKRLSDLKTPRPIAEAPRDGTNILGVWLTGSAPEVMHWDGSYWTDEGEELVYKPSHYLPLPEVKP